MVFRRDSKGGDAFQRQISALRQQLGSENEAEGTMAEAEAEQLGDSERVYDTYPPVATAPMAEGSPAPANASGYRDALDGEGVTGATVPTAPPMPELPAVDAATTVIAQDATWKGEISSEGTVHVHGRFEGTLRAKRDVYVADQADVDATVNAERVTIAGTIKGTIRCGTRFEVLPSGRVTGDVQSPTLVVHEGATVTGQFRMGADEGTIPEERETSVVQRRAARGSA